MDVKKLFDMEHKLESMRPELTDAELLDTVDCKSDKVDDVASMSLTMGDKGLYLKTVTNDGIYKKMIHLNPVVAEALAYEILEGLNNLGIKQEDFSAQIQTNNHKKLH